jgi:hypothetical protein
MILMGAGYLTIEKQFDTYETEHDASDKQWNDCNCDVRFHLSIKKLL